MTTEEFHNAGFDKYRDAILLARAIGNRALVWREMQAASTKMLDALIFTEESALAWDERQCASERELEAATEVFRLTAKIEEQALKTGEST